MTEDADQTETLVILHVEDDPAHAELLREGFRGHRLAHEIHHVATGMAALDYLLRRDAYEDPAASPRPDVVLLDLRMPGMDGLEVLAEMRSHDDLAEMPVVVLTTSEAEGDRLESYRNQISAYIVKPMGFDSFAVLLDVIILAIKNKSRPGDAA